MIHLHGGELTYGAVDDSIRYAISKIARLHFVTTQQYKKRLLQIGENPKNVIVSGSPILEHVKKYAKYNFNELKKIWLILKNRLYCALIIQRVVIINLI